MTAKVFRTVSSMKATENKALRNFNKLDEDFKFVVLTLANRNNPGAFRS
jgi:hypothetical protein